MFGRKKVYIVHESRKSYEKRRNNRIAYGLLGFIFLIYLALNNFVFFVSLVVIGSGLGLIWKLLVNKSKKKST